MLFSRQFSVLYFCSPSGEGTLNFMSKGSDGSEGQGKGK